MSWRGCALMAGWLALLPAVHGSEPVAAYRIVADGIPARLTAAPGDAQRGRAIAIDSRLGNCLICHAAPMPGVPVFGNVGPPLDGVGRRLSEAQLRLRVVDTRRLNPATIMPPYHSIQALHRVAPKHRGQPILTAQEVEDVVAFLLTLR